MQKERSLKGFFIRALVVFLITTLISGLVLLIETLIGYKFNKEAFLMITNATFIGGLVVTCFYVLSVLSNEGAYDLLTYSVKLFWYNTFNRNVRKTKLAASYADYREEKRGKVKNSTLFLLIGALPYLLAGIILGIISANMR